MASTTVTMLEDHKACPDGFTLTLLEKGESYQFPARFAEHLVDRGLAKTGGSPKRAAPAADDSGGETGQGEPPAADDPIAGMNAKQAVATVAELELEQLDAIPADEDRKTVLDAIAARRAEIAAGDGDG